MIFDKRSILQTCEIRMKNFFQISLQTKGRKGDHFLKNRFFQKQKLIVVSVTSPFLYGRNKNFTLHVTKLN
jgi:hypothetical protein